ncbi:hypothetical protein WH43_07770 [Rheinheimera sp. KL1]|nr:hypothetical protein WH43_07770 [Rheinheimera sp. KL1]
MLDDSAQSNWSCSKATSERDPRSIVVYVTGARSAVNAAAASSTKGAAAIAREIRYTCHIK